MSGDLSLSQSLGGLRIANPDQDNGSPKASPGEQISAINDPLSLSPANSPQNPTPLSKSELLPILTHETTGQSSASGDFGFDPFSYNMDELVSPATSSRKPSDASPTTVYTQRVLNHRRSAQLHRSPPVPNSIPGGRYLNDMYMQPNISSSSHHSSYRYREDSTPDLSATGLARNGSRATRNVLSDAQEPGRTYRQGSAAISDGNGAMPQRRSSQRSRAATQGSAQGHDARASYSGAAYDDARAAAAIPRNDTNDATRQASSRSTVKKGVKDFTFGRTLGEGSYSTVTAATDRQTLKEYAIKVLDKRHIIKEKKVKYVNIERDTLNRLTEHPGVVRLYYTFQDERSLYFVLDLASQGELLGVLKKLGSFDVECTQFYAAEILDSIAYMHSRGVIHRDLKPENVLLDRDMHVKITDFGTAKILSESRNARGTMDAAGDPTDGAETDRANSFVGTAEYVSPELLRDKNACKASDLWAFGCIVFQLLAGRPPFKAANEYLTFQKILSLDFRFPTGFPEVARDLVERLLVLDPASRLPVEHIKNHRFFDGIQWGRGLWRQKAPRLKPYVAPISQPQPIRLNGPSVRKGDLSASAAAAAMSNSPSQPPPSNPRPQLRGVTDLPPPSQLDIDWSPVLTHNNERILKLGNLNVSVSPQGQVPLGEPGTPPEKSKISRFFSGATVKKRERLVLITSSARLLIAPAGGNEKKAKMDLDCLATDSSWKSYVDSKGLTAWYLDTREKHIIFEDPRATTSDPAGSKYSTQEWLDSLEQARELAIAGNSVAASYSGDSMLYSNLDSTISSPTESVRGDPMAALGGAEPSSRHNLRQTLRRNTDDDSFKGRKRFSKRHSKGGLAAVF